ncbi:peptide ABC transporter substrate-binding protein [Caldibacillus thermoamylovorans]|uniref:peptide ABC transporter substrate-binding protein n=1 Tax=Caldibacillus thermoamylovorans TaxID=35841 RepID=UPI00203F2154|nr:peptide ABC transporter substrate-binding protein [Caldibacillus thermoamylovorans]MCM3798143.1 peptide ABC transporter substrate-binding protein [Caldibacillus thermoamylovorans]
MKKKKWSLLLAALLLVSTVLAACGGKSDESSEKGSGDTDKSSEQVLRLMNGDQIPTMDSSMATDQYAFQFLGESMEGLYRLGKDGKVEDGMAIDHEVSDDGLTWTFKLREDAKWSNGDPVTAHDFVYAWRRAVDPATGSEYGPYMMGGVIKNATAVNKGEVAVEELGVRAEDDHTLVVELENPTPYFESLTTFGTFLPMNQKFVEAQGDKYATSTDTLVFNGPFTLEKWTSTANKWELVKNENYWDKDSVKLDKITFVVVKDPQAGVDLYEKGEVDRAGLSSDLVDMYSSNDDYITIPEPSVFYLKLNQVRNGEKTPLANVNIRKAIMMAVDKEAGVNEILNNGSIAANGLIPKDFVEVPSTGKDFREQNGDLAVYNKEEAKKYWEQGLKELGVTSVSLEFMGDDGESAKVFNEYVANQLKTNLPGLEITIKNVPFEQRLDADKAQDYDIQFAGWGPDYLDPYTFLSLWITDGGNNKMGYSNPEYDKLLQDVQTTLANDQDKRYEAMLQAEKILFEDAAIVPMYQRSLALLSSPKVHNIIANKFGPDYEWKWTYIE